MTCTSPVEIFLRAAGVVFQQNDVHEIFVTCTGPVGVFLPAADIFSAAKMTFRGFLGHVIALLRSSYLPQALFFRQTVADKGVWLYL